MLDVLLKTQRNRLSAKRKLRLMALEVEHGARAETLTHPCGLNLNGDSSDSRQACSGPLPLPGVHVGCRECRAFGGGILVFGVRRNSEYRNTGMPHVSNF